MRRLALLAALLVAAVLAVPALAATKTVAVKDGSFGPSKVTIHKGQKVTFRWHGSLPHNVRAYAVPRGAKRFNSGVASHHRPYTRAFTVRGTYKIICDVHGYTGRIVVR